MTHWPPDELKRAISILNDHKRRRKEKMMSSDVALIASLHGTVFTSHKDVWNASSVSYYDRTYPYKDIIFWDMEKKRTLLSGHISTKLLNAVSKYSKYAISSHRNAVLQGQVHLLHRPSCKPLPYDVTGTLLNEHDELIDEDGNALYPNAYGYDEYEDKALSLSRSIAQRVTQGKVAGCGGAAAKLPVPNNFAGTPYERLRNYVMSGMSVDDLDAAYILTVTLGMQHETADYSEFLRSCEPAAFKQRWRPSTELERIHAHLVGKTMVVNGVRIGRPRDMYKTLYIKIYYALMRVGGYL